MKGLAKLDFYLQSSPCVSTWGFFYYDNIYSIMPETYISMGELLDRMNRHPDVKNASKAQQMLNALGCKQDKTKKPRVHITKSKNKQKYLLVV